jgi:hypothetical protein
MGRAVRIVGLVQSGRTEAEAAILCQCGVKSVSVVFGEFAVFFRPFAEKPLQFLNAIGTLRIDWRVLNFSYWFDAHGLPLVEASLNVKNNDAIFDVSD